MIEILKRTVDKYWVDIKKAKEICGDFAFDLAMLQDQGQIILDKEEYRPVICFDNMDGQLRYNSDKDFQLHDYAFGNTTKHLTSKSCTQLGYINHMRVHFGYHRLCGLNLFGND